MQRVKSVKVGHRCASKWLDALKRLKRLFLQDLLLENQQRFSKTVWYNKLITDIRYCTLTPFEKGNCESCQLSFVKAATWDFHSVQLSWPYWVLSHSNHTKQASLYEVIYGCTRLAFTIPRGTEVRVDKIEGFTPKMERFTNSMDLRTHLTLLDQAGQI